MGWGIYGLDLTTDVELFHAITKVGNGRMSGIIRAKNLDSFVDLIGTVDILD